MRLKRRLIPPLFAATMVGLATAPLFLERTDADRWTTLYALAIFLFLVLLFLAMRHRMVDRRRRLTVFGYATVDLFTALILFFLVFEVVFGIRFYYLTVEELTPERVQHANRVAFIGAGSLVLATGAAVAYEMRRIKGVLLVHEEAENHTH